MHQQSDLWLAGFAPGERTPARARFRRSVDVAQVERFDPAVLLGASTIHEALRQSAGYGENRPAITYLESAEPDGPTRVISYGELLDGVERAAALFGRIAEGQKPIVTILAPLLPEALIAAWGAATVGIWSPINPFLDADYVAAIMRSTGSNILVTADGACGAGAWDRLDEIRRAVPGLKRILVIGSGDADNFMAAIAATPRGSAFVPVEDPDADVTYLPTGGTTGAPKLVRMTHRGELLQAWSMGFQGGSSPDDVVGHAIPNFHVGGATTLCMRALLYGQLIVTLTRDGFRNKAVLDNFWPLVRAHGITTTSIPVATAAALLSLPGEAGPDCPLRIINCGGATIPLDVLRAFHDRFGIWLREVWGMSEVHGTSTGHPGVERPPLAGSVGQRLPFYDVRAVHLDEDNRFVRACAAGERGMLAIGSIAVAPGYLQSERDSELFIQGMPGQVPWASTGDLGAIDDNGYVWVFGRAKDLIIRGGHNIDPKLIEEVLNAHPAVELSAAIGQPDAEKGEMPIAYVQLVPGVAATAEELVAYCRPRVKERAAAPVEIFLIDRLPLTPALKVNKVPLRLDALRRVAERVARTAIGAEIGEIAIDERGLRPSVVVYCRAEEDARESLADVFAEAFRPYAFTAVLNWSDP